MTHALGAIVMVTARPLRGTRFLVRWIAAGSFAWLLGGVLANPVAHMISTTIMPAPQGKIDDIIAGLLGILVSTTLIMSLGSTVQALLLRERIPRLYHWIVLSSAGWVCGIVVGLCLAFILSLPMAILMDGIIGSLATDAVRRSLSMLIVSSVTIAVVGAILGVFQCLVLRRSLPQTTMWIWTSALGATGGWLLTVITIQWLTPFVPSLGVGWWVIVCSVGGGVYSSVTGIGLGWLFEYAPYAQIQVNGRL
jgi:uncharacterized membrane protein YeaQ/YmgE (transglycosylase-associated protein family)